ncbi:transposase domain-containing protein [Kibdelosporangium philippinense]|uniref:transposase domain-containing protein n=1 Tax=Kibdelosporangium philippinense TaxID=211113 RepID=UPI00360D704B
MYFVLALCLFSGESHEEVMRKLVQGLRYFGSWTDKWHVPTSGALTKARARPGEDPLQILFERVEVPRAQPATRGAWLRDWRLISLDGTVLDLPATNNQGDFDTPINPRQSHHQLNR